MWQTSANTSTRTVTHSHTYIHYVPYSSNKECRIPTKCYRIVSTAHRLPYTHTHMHRSLYSHICTAAAKHSYAQEQRHWKASSSCLSICIVSRHFSSLVCVVVAAEPIKFNLLAFLHHLCSWRACVKH